MERFKAEGIDFAFPSQTMYLAGDSKRPLNLDQQLSSAQAGNRAAAAKVSSPAGSVTRPAREGNRDNADIEEALLRGEDEAGESDDSTS